MRKLFSICFVGGWVDAVTYTHTYRKSKSSRWWRIQNSCFSENFFIRKLTCCNTHAVSAQTVLREYYVIRDHLRVGSRGLGVGLERAVGVDVVSSTQSNHTLRTHVET